MEKRLKDAGYVKRDDFFNDECCHCVHKKKIDDDTRYCTKLGIYVGENDVCNYFYDYYKTDEARLQIRQLAKVLSQKD